MRLAKAEVLLIWIFVARDWRNVHFLTLHICVSLHHESIPILGFTGVNFIFLIPAQKHRDLVLVRTA